MDSNAAELMRLNEQRQLLIDRVQERAVNTLYIAAASYPGISLAQEAADAARQNLELVTDSYARGAVSVIDLLDAQTSSLAAAQSAANAEYDFLLDLMAVQRASGQFDYFMTASERARFFNELGQWFNRETQAREPVAQPARAAVEERQPPLTGVDANEAAAAAPETVTSEQPVQRQHSDSQPPLRRANSAAVRPVAPVPSPARAPARVLPQPSTEPAPAAIEVLCIDPNNRERPIPCAQ